MRKDSEIFLKEILKYRKNIKRDSFSLNCKHFKEIPNIESAIYEIIKDLINNSCITSESEVEDLDGNIKICLTLDGIKYFESFNNKTASVERSDSHGRKKGNIIYNDEENKGINENISLVHDVIHNTVMNKFIKKRFSNITMDMDIFEAYSELFKSFVCVKNDDLKELEVDNLFMFIADKVDETNNENFIKVVGPDGTGKSTFLSLLYIYLYECFCSKTIKEYPFYINLHYYDSNVINAESLDELNAVVKEKIREDLEALIEFSKTNPKINFLIIIDGNEKYERTHLKSSIFLENLLSEIQSHKKIICLGEKTNIYFFRERNNDVYIDNLTTYTISFSSIYINEKNKWEEEIRKFCKLFDNEKQINNINKCIEKFSIKELDYNLLTIFCEVSKKNNLANIFSVSDLYHQYCLEHLEKSEKRLNISTCLAYKYFMTKEFIEQKYIYTNWKEWELVHQHKMVSNYLLALYYSNIIFDGKAENVKQFECVFTNGINTFLKSIINKTKSNQRETLKFCRLMFNEGDFRIKAQAAYLAGRVEDARLQDDARELLNSQLSIWNLKNASNDNKRRELFFVKRSILVSLLYLEDCSAGEVLLKDFFDFPVMNEVNRAFYLQYYEDVIKEPEVVNLKDNGQEEITYTVSVLFNFINTELLKDELEWRTQSRYIFQVYLFTLCSLIQQRINARKSLSAEIDKLKLILEETIKCLGNDLEDDMRDYILMLQEDIYNKSYDIGHLYDELYGLKDIQRKGWVEKIERGSIQVDRYENVIEHTYYSWLLGMLYLPEKAPFGKEFSRYDKRKILNCLLIHDLAENYVGDKLPEEISNKHREAENECMRRIFRHDMYFGIENMDCYRKAWKGFGLDSSDINGKIAKEIDIIQAIYQFCVYKTKGAQFTREKEIEWKKERYKIKTPIGKKILREVVLKKFKNILE